VRLEKNSRSDLLTTKQLFILALLVHHQIGKRAGVFIGIYQDGKSSFLVKIHPVIFLPLIDDLVAEPQLLNLFNWLASIRLVGAAPMMISLLMIAVFSMSLVFDHR
jgi:hypothetical protein